jgi:aspartyl-tRNA synthetase
MKRTHHCNELRASDAGRAVILTGWVHSRRDLGGVLFIDLRDREGRTQTVFDPSDLPPAVFDVASKLHAESVIEIEGKVRVRPEGTRNIKILSGEVEVQVQSMTLNELNYAPEIAGAMLKKQQAGALLEAREIIVDGAVGIAIEAVKKLEEQGGMTVSSEDKVKIMTNIITVLTGEGSATPVLPVGA